MERPRLRGLKSLFGRANKSQLEQSPSPLAKDTQQPPARPVSNRPDQPPAHAHIQVSQQQPPPQAIPKPTGQLSLTFFGISDPGLKRPNNEDHFIVADLTRQIIAVEDNVIVPETVHQSIGAKGTLLST